MVSIVVIFVKCPLLLFLLRNAATLQEDPYFARNINKIILSLFQIALATFLLNISILILKRSDEIGISILADVIPDILTNVTDPEAQFRAYVALGSLLSTTNLQQNQQVKAKVMENTRFLEKLKIHVASPGSDVELKRKNCAAQVQRVLLL